MRCAFIQTRIVEKGWDLSLLHISYYWVPRVQEVAKEHGIPFKAIHITDKESAQNVPAPVTTYALFRDGQFLTQSIQSDKKFLALSRPFT